MATETVDDKFVALASIASDLHSVMEVAWGVSMAAKNAKVISAQSGSEADGFQPITDFIEEIAHQSMDGVDEINTAALELTKLAVDEQRHKEARDRFLQVQQQTQDLSNSKSLTPAIERAKRQLSDSQTVLRRKIIDLELLLESMEECMLSASSVASVSRIVTSGAEEHRDKLKVVSDELDEATKFIKEKLATSHRHLQYVKAQTVR